MTTIPPSAATPAPVGGGSTTQAGASSATPENPGGALGKNDFLKLMVAQLQAQNPLEPTNNTEYIAELAQFSQLEQIGNLAQTSSQQASSQQVAQAVALIGRTVTCATPGSGAALVGTVQNVDITSTGATLTVAGTPGVEPSSITQVS